MSIKVIKLKNDEEIVCDFIHFNGNKIRNPLIINVYYDNGYIIQVEKFLKHLKYNDELELKDDDIQFIYKPSDELILYYQKNIMKVKESDNNVKLLFSSFSSEKPIDETTSHTISTIH